MSTTRTPILLAVAIRQNDTDVLELSLELDTESRARQEELIDYMLATFKNHALARLSEARA